MKDPEKEFQIFVNTKPRKVPGPTITFEQVLQLAGMASEVTGVTSAVERLRPVRLERP